MKINNSNDRNIKTKPQNAVKVFDNTFVFLPLDLFLINHFNNRPHQAVSPESVTRPGSEKVLFPSFVKKPENNYSSWFE